MTYENESADNPVSRVLPWVAIAAAAFLFYQVTSMSAFQPAPKTATVETISVATAAAPAHS